MAVDCALGILTSQNLKVRRSGRRMEWMDGSRRRTLVVEPFDKGATVWRIHLDHYIAFTNPPGGEKQEITVADDELSAALDWALCEPDAPPPFRMQPATASRWTPSMRSYLWSRKAELAYGASRPSKSGSPF